MGIYVGSDYTGDQPSLGGLNLSHDGAAPAPPVFSNTLSTNFDGVDEYGTIPYSASLQRQGVANWSISFYIKTTSSSNQGIFGTWDYSTGNRQWFIRLNAAGTVSLFTSADGSSTNEAASSVTINSGSWVHVIISYSNVSAPKLWLNGSSSPIGLAYAAFLHNYNGPITVGAFDKDLTVGDFQGNLDEICLWNAGFNNTTASELYNSGSPIDPAGHSLNASLVSHWRMGDGDTHPTISDQVGANNMTLVNSESGDFQSDVP